MLPGLALASLLAAAPSEATQPPKPTPEQRLAELDERRVALNMGARGYGRLIGIAPAYGGGVELGLGVRVVRGLYIQGEVDLGTHAMPVGVGARGFIGLRHELRMTKWVRPSLSIGYSHLLDAHFSGDLATLGDDERLKGEDFGFGFGAGGEASLASHSGVAVGLGLRFPFRSAPRLSFYLDADAAYYFADFDDRPGRVHVGGSMGISLVF